MAKRNDRKGNGDWSGTISISILCSIIVFSPGIVLASIIDHFISLTISLIWIIVALSTFLLIAIPFYFTNYNNLLFRHFVISGIIFIILVIYTIVDGSNMFYLTLKKMYPVFMI